jgi:hypothetical protein
VRPFRPVSGLRHIQMRKPNMRSKTLTLFTATTLWVALALSVQLSAQTYTTFDPPNSISTQPTSINQQGAIAGWFADMNGVNHGFLRAHDGTITIFDAPNLGTAQGQPGTQPTAINQAGVVTGLYQDANFVL